MVCYSPCQDLEEHTGKPSKSLNRLISTSNETRQRDGLTIFIMYPVLKRNWIKLSPSLLGKRDTMSQHLLIQWAWRLLISRSVCSNPYFKYTSVNRQKCIANNSVCFRLRLLGPGAICRVRGRAAASLRHSFLLSKVEKTVSPTAQTKGDHTGLMTSHAYDQIPDQKQLEWGGVFCWWFWRV